MNKPTLSDEPRLNLGEGNGLGIELSVGPHAFAEFDLWLTQELEHLEAAYANYHVPGASGWRRGAWRTSPKPR